MKVGDLVTITGSFANSGLAGVILEAWVGCGGWWCIMTKEGVINWPGSQMRVVSESR